MGEGVIFFIGSYNPITWSLMLLWLVIECLEEGGVLLDEMSLGGTLRGYSLTFLLVLLLQFVFVFEDVISQLLCPTTCCHASPTMPCLPYHANLSPSETKS